MRKCTWGDPSAEGGRRTAAERLLELKGRSLRGASLIEALIALTILGVALLMGVSFLMMERLLERRVEKHREVLRLMENELELLRALPGPPADREAFVPEGGSSDLLFTVDTGDLFPEGLHQVTLTATYSIDGHPYERKVETMVWKPET